VKRLAELHSKHCQDKVLGAEGSFRKKSQTHQDDDETGGTCRGGQKEHAWKMSNLELKPGEKLRIGYVSADFVNHPTADLMQSALLLHDMDKYEVFLYSITRNDSSVYRKVLQREHGANFRVLPNAITDKKCAEMVAGDGIHILVNLNSHTAGERNGIFAFRPAPVQVVYLAFPGTHGATYIDYNVVDKTVVPSHNRQYFSESLVYMPHCYQTNSYRDVYPEILDPQNLPSRAAHGLPEEAVVFCTFNRLGRITPEVFARWIRILEKVPNSVIWLYRHPTFAVLRCDGACPSQCCI